VGADSRGFGDGLLVRIGAHVQAPRDRGRASPPFRKPPPSCDSRPQICRPNAASGGRVAVAVSSTRRDCHGSRAASNCTRGCPGNSRRRAGCRSVRPSDGYRCSSVMGRDEARPPRAGPDATGAPESHRPCHAAAPRRLRSIADPDRARGRPSRCPAASHELPLKAAIRRVEDCCIRAASVPGRSVGKRGRASNCRCGVGGCPDCVEDVSFQCERGDLNPHALSGTGS
jgi:hypothetical protein